MVFILLRVAYFTYHTVFKVYRGWSVCQNFIPFYSRIIFHCMCLPWPGVIPPGPCRPHPQWSPGSVTVTSSPVWAIYTTRISTLTFNICSQYLTFKSELSTVGRQWLWISMHSCVAPAGSGAKVREEHGHTAWKDGSGQELYRWPHRSHYEHEVSALPTTLATKNGNVVDKPVGIRDELRPSWFPCPPGPLRCWRESQVELPALLFWP